MIASKGSDEADELARVASDSRAEADKDCFNAVISLGSYRPSSGGWCTGVAEESAVTPAVLLRCYFQMVTSSS